MKSKQTAASDIHIGRRATESLFENLSCPIPMRAPADNMSGNLYSAPLMIMLYTTKQDKSEVEEKLRTKVLLRRLLRFRSNIRRNINDWIQ